jgi:hypothetical protein
VRHRFLLASQTPVQAPSHGVAAGRGRLHLAEDGLGGRGGAHPPGRDGEAAQQFGRTRTRDRAGSTGRAEYAKAGDKLGCLFFIGALLVCGSLTHARDEPQRTGNFTFILIGWSCRVNASMRKRSAGAKLANVCWVIGTCETAGEFCNTYKSRSAGTENPGWSAYWPPLRRVRQLNIVTKAEHHHRKPSLQLMPLDSSS